jgi:hypothetical protein
MPVKELWADANVGSRMRARKPRQPRTGQGQVVDRVPDRAVFGAADEQPHQGASAACAAAVAIETGVETRPGGNRPSDVHRTIDAAAASRADFMRAIISGTIDKMVADQAPVR